MRPHLDSVFQTEKEIPYWQTKPQIIMILLVNKIAITIYKFLLSEQFNIRVAGIQKIGYNKIPHGIGRALGLCELLRGIAKIATSPPVRAATPATAKAGEFPPPNS